MEQVRIIVLTPIKNEDWVLENFLTIASKVADNIIIADQESEDNSRNICLKFPKVILIKNKSHIYDEAERQILLINTARQLFQNDKRIFFCLDADEIFSHNSLKTKDEWEKIKEQKIGTAIYVEKPDILAGLKECVRWKNNYFPIGFVDDGRNHIPSKIHSMRIPPHLEDEKLYLSEIKILHLAHARKNVQSSKLRYYSVIENIQQTKPVYLRRFAYPCFYDAWKVYPTNAIEPIPESWLHNWTIEGIDWNELPDPEIGWHDFAVLAYFEKYGTKKFYFENIWEVDWEAVRQVAIMNSKLVSHNKIKKPKLVYLCIGKTIDFFYRVYRFFRTFKFK